MSWPDDPNKAEKIIGPIYDDFAAKAAEDPFFQPFADKLKEELDNAPADPVPEPPGGGGDIFTLLGASETYDGAVTKVKGTHPFGRLLTLTQPEGQSGSAIPSNAIGVDFLKQLSALPCMGISAGPADPDDPSQGTLVLKYGAIRLDSWIFNTYDGVAKTLFVGSNGNPTQSVPNNTPGQVNLIQPIGSIISRHIMWFYPSSTIYTRMTIKDGDGEDISVVTPYML